MKCPLILKAHWALGLLQPHEKVDCLKEKCAWWDEVENGRCSILSLVCLLDDIATKLMHIDDNIMRLKEGK